MQRVVGALQPLIGKKKWLLCTTLLKLIQQNIIFLSQNRIILLTMCLIKSLISCSVFVLTKSQKNSFKCVHSTLVLLYAQTQTHNFLMHNKEQLNNTNCNQKKSRRQHARITPKHTHSNAHLFFNGNIVVALYVF